MTAVATLLPNEPLRIEVTLAGRSAVARMTHCTMTDDGRLVPMPNTALELTPKGAAAAAYLQARANFWDEVNEPSRWIEPQVPNWDTPEVHAAQAVMDAAAQVYRETHEGAICEDCGHLEKCVCPDV